MNRVPEYLRIYEKLRDDIVSGAVRRGDRLPSKRALAEAEGVSVITAQHALDLLADEGYIVSRQRSGCFAVYSDTGSAPRSPVARMPAKQASHIPSDRDDRDFPFTAYARSMRRVLTEYDRGILGRCPGNGREELRQAIAAYLARSRGIEASPENIIVGSGAEYLYSLIVQLLGRERELALEDPSYEKIRQVYEANGARCVMLKLGDNGIFSDELAACRAVALHVTPYDSRPAGVTADGPKRHEYARWAREHDSYIIEDDYTSETVSAKKKIETVYSLAPERVIYLNTFTRTMAPSIRIGYMLLPEVLRQRYEQQLHFYSCTVPVFDQLVLADFIAGGDLERHISRLRRKEKNA